jgi:hypothetical protein
MEGKTLKEVASLMGVSVDVPARLVKKLFPDIMPRQGKTIHLTDKQVELLKDYPMQKAQAKADAAKGKVSVGELAEKIGYSEDLIRQRIRDLYPGLMIKSKPTYLTPEQAECIANRAHKKPGIKPGYKFKPKLKPVKPPNPVQPKIHKSPDIQFGPSVEELKKIQAEEIARKAASFRKWYEERKNARISDCTEN